MKLQLLIKRLLLPLLAALALPTAIEANAEEIICKNTNNLTLATLVGRKAFFGWFNDNYSESIRAYDEYIKCFAKTNDDKAFALTIRGLAKESKGDIKGACNDWKKVIYLEDEAGKRYNPFPYYWSVFKDKYKKERKSKDHTNAFQTVEKEMESYDYEARNDFKYYFTKC